MKKINKLALLLIFLFTFLAFAYGDAKEERKIALLIANDNYDRDLGKLSEPIVVLDSCRNDPFLTSSHRDGAVVSI